MHHIAGEFQCRAQFAARMEDAKIECRESSAFKKRDRERVAQRELHQRRGGRRQVVRTGFAGLRQRQNNVRSRAERAAGASGDSDQRNSKTPRISDQVLKLFSLARPRQRQHDVVRRNHAEIAVACIGGVDKKCRRSGRRKRRSDLARHVTGLAHAGDDDASARVADGVDGSGEWCAQAVAHRRSEGVYAVAFGAERSQRRSDVGTWRPKSWLFASGEVTLARFST